MRPKKEMVMEENNKIEEDTKKLASLVVYMSMVVIVLFGLVPLI